MDMAKWVVRYYCFLKLFTVKFQDPGGPLPTSANFVAYVYEII